MLDKVNLVPRNPLGSDKRSRIGSTASASVNHGTGTLFTYKTLDPTSLSPDLHNHHPQPTIMASHPENEFDSSGITAVYRQPVNTLGHVRLQDETGARLLVPQPSSDPNDPLNW